MSNNIIEQERHGLWIAVTLIIAILALVLSFINLHRTHALAALTQVQVLSIDKRLDNMSKQPEASDVAAPAPAAE